MPLLEVGEDDIVVSVRSPSLNRCGLCLDDLVIDLQAFIFVRAIDAVGAVSVVYCRQ